MKANLKILAFCIVAVIAIVCVGVYGADGAISFIVGGGTIMAAVPIVGGGVGVEGTLTTDDLLGQDGITDDDLNRLIINVRPSDTPLDTLTRELQNVQSVASEECGGYEIGTRDIADTVTLAYAGGTDVANIKVGKKGMWQINETIFCPEIVGGGGLPLQLYIIGKNNTESTLQVIAVNPLPDTFIPALALNTKLLRLGKAMGELAAQTDPFTALPSNRTNYTQIHMTQVETSTLSELRKKKVALDFSTHRELAVWDMKRGMELTNLFGIKGKRTNPEKNNETVYFSNGLWNQVDKTYEYDKAVAPTNKNFTAMARYIFDGNNGSEKRVMLAGPAKLEWLSQIEAYSKQIEAKNTEVVLGVKFNKIETPFGELLIKPMSGLFVGAMAECALVLDMSYIVKYVYENLQTTPLELDKTGQRRAKAVRIHENYALFAENLEVHCKIRPK